MRHGPYGGFWTVREERDSGLAPDLPQFSCHMYTRTHGCGRCRCIVTAAADVAVAANVGPRMEFIRFSAGGRAGERQKERESDSERRRPFECSSLGRRSTSSPSKPSSLSDHHKNPSSFPSLATINRTAHLPPLKRTSFPASIACHEPDGLPKHRR